MQAHHTTGSGYSSLPTPVFDTPDTMPDMPNSGSNRTGQIAGLGNQAKSLLPTPVVNDMGAGKTVEHWDEWTEKTKAKHQNGNGHGPSLNIELLRLLPEVPEESLIRTPSVTDSTGGAISEDTARERGRMVKTADQMAQLAAENGLKVSPSIAESLLPTPNTMDMLPARTPEQKALNKGKGGYANLRESVVNDLLPTPKALDGIKGNLKTSEERIAAGHFVDLTNVANDLALMRTPQVDDAKNTGHNQERRTTLASEVWETERTTNWGKFEPAIRRWEQVLGRPAPAPTKPDGKEGAHRLSSKFTEWMMGLPDGWITDAGLTRNEELKACGNGVVPQQAELALRLLLGDSNMALGGGEE